jgi:hypothetical protein
MKKLVLLLSATVLLSCSKESATPKTYCWTYTKSCSITGGTPTVKTETECGGTETEWQLLVLELERYGCKVTNVSKK